MGATVFLVTADLAVEPGEEAGCDVVVRNTSDIVDQYRLDIVGGAQEWATIEPAVVNLLPGDDVTAHVTFRPPRSSAVLAGVFPFGVRAQSREDPLRSAVEEGEIEVAPFTEIVTELVPTKCRGRKRAKFRLAVDNNGNSPVDIEVTAIDEADMLDIVVSTPTITAHPGTATLVNTTVIPTRRFLKGEPKEHAFQLVAQPLIEGGQSEPFTTNGSMIQEQLVPKWLMAAALLTAAGAIAIVALWFTVLKPTVQSTAREEAKQQVSHANEAAMVANEAAVAANEAAKEAQEAAGTGDDAAGKPGGNGGDDAGGSGSDDGTAGGGTNGRTGPEIASEEGKRAPTSFRLVSAAPPVSDGSFKRFSHTAPDRRGLQLTDIVLQNPRGDSGVLRIQLGDDIVLEVGLDNFRDLDYHYVVPLHVAPGEPVSLLVNCVEPGQDAAQCSPSASFSGWMTR